LSENLKQVEKKLTEIDLQLKNLNESITRLNNEIASSEVNTLTRHIKEIAEKQREIESLENPLARINSN